MWDDNDRSEVRSLHGKNSVVNGGIYTLWKPREFSPVSIPLEVAVLSGTQAASFHSDNRKLWVHSPTYSTELECLPCMQRAASVGHSALSFTGMPLITCSFLHQMPATSAAVMQRNSSLWLLILEQSQKWNFIHTNITYISLVTERKCGNNKMGFSRCIFPPQNILQNTFIIIK